MNPERLQLKGMLAESRKKFQLLDTEASGLVILIRTLLNPYAEVKNLDTKKNIYLMKLREYLFMNIQQLMKWQIS